MVRRMLLVFLGLAVCAPAYGKTKGQAQAPLALPICSVLSQASQYDGQVIRVRGIYRAGAQGPQFYGPDCESQDHMVNVREADSKAHKQFVKAMRNLDASRPLDMVIRGKFSVAKTGCFGAACNHYEIRETWLSWVRPANP